MRKIVFFIGILIILASCMAGAAAAAPLISFDPATVTLASGSTAQVKVILNEAPRGLAGYKLTVHYPSDTVTVIDATFPSWGSTLNMKTPAKGGYLISAIDLNKEVQGGSSGILLGTITLKGISAGSGTLSISDIQMNDDTDAVIAPVAGTMQVTTEGSSIPVTTTTTTVSATSTTVPVTTGPTAASTTPTTTMTVTSTTVPLTTGTTAVTTTAAVTLTTIVPAATVTVPSVVMVTPALAGSPTCGFTVNKVAGYAPLEVRFRDLSTGESISGWEWSFGDGGSSMTQSPTYTYRTPGTYTVTLMVTNGLGSTTSARTGLIRVLNEGEAMPTVTQAAPPITAETTQPVHTIPVWTPPEKSSTAPTKQASSSLPLALAGTGIAAAVCLFLQKKIES